MPKIISIKCKGTKSIDLDDLVYFQGALKELSKDNFEKLKKSFLKYGFRIPIFVWRKNIMDGHQRYLVLSKLKEEGYQIDKIPIVEIEAKDIKQAKEILLLINSRYGKITDEGLYEFVETSGLDINGMIGELELPEIDFGKFVNGFYDNSSDPELKDIGFKEEEKESMVITFFSINKDAIIEKLKGIALEYEGFGYY